MPPKKNRRNDYVKRVEDALTLGANDRGLSDAEYLDALHELQSVISAMIEAKQQEMGGVK